PIDGRGVVVGALIGKGSELVQLDARLRSGRAGLAAAVLVRGARGMPNCVVAPGVARAAASEARERVLTAGFDGVLGQLARAHGLSIAGFGFADEFDGRAARCVVLRGADEDERSGMELVASWCLLAASDAMAPLRREAARALGACGWPDAVLWMEERWLASRGAAGREFVWLDGLIAAANRGALAPCWRTRAERDWIANWFADPGADREPELRRERASGLSRALALAGPRDDSGADARAWLVLDDAPGAELANWARLVVLEGLGIDDGAELDRRTAAWSASGRSALVFQALRARATGAAKGGVELARPEPLFEWASRSGRVRGLVAVLAAARAEPAAEWDDPARLPRDWPPELARAACEWELVSTRPAAAAARHVVARLTAADDAERLAACELLRRCARRLGVERVRAVLGSAQYAARDELAAALGLASAEERAAVLARSAPNELVHALALGELAANGVAEARATLLDALRDVQTLSTALHGLDWAVASARARRDEDGERALVQAVRAAAQPVSAALRSRLAADAWPAPNVPDPVDLDALFPEAPADLR
ncbi:MAG: hypothetical protein HZA53_02615, partial [Planctomycetes bacterium]|nr:hypothetical protein [Planctomycetota bacterium]